MKALDNKSLFRSESVRSMQRTTEVELLDCSRHRLL